MTTASSNTCVFRQVSANNPSPHPMHHGLHLNAPIAVVLPFSFSVWVSFSFVFSLSFSSLLFSFSFSFSFPTRGWPSCSNSFPLMLCLPLAPARPESSGEAKHVRCECETDATWAESALHALSINNCRFADASDNECFMPHDVRIERTRIMLLDVTSALSSVMYIQSIRKMASIPQDRTPTVFVRKRRPSSPQRTFSTSEKSKRNNPVHL